MVIRTTNTNEEYQYSKYKIGDVLEVVGEYDEHYIARMLSGSEYGGVIAVKKIDCERVHLGSYKPEGPITMMT